VNGGAVCTDTPNDATPGIPSWMQFYATDTDATAAAGKAARASTTGGFRDAMDYVPVPIG
jgi:hypothetical protein